MDRGLVVGLDHGGVPCGAGADEKGAVVDVADVQFPDRAARELRDGLGAVHGLGEVAGEAVAAADGHHAQADPAADQPGADAADSAVAAADHDAFHAVGDRGVDHFEGFAGGAWEIPREIVGGLLPMDGKGILNAPEGKTGACLLVVEDSDLAECHRDSSVRNPAAATCSTIQG